MLYSWDGDPADPPLATGTALPLEPAGANEGSWETIVAVPDPLTAGSSVQLFGGQRRHGLVRRHPDCQDRPQPGPAEDLGQIFSYVPGTPLATSTTTLASAPCGHGGDRAAGDVHRHRGRACGSLGAPTGTVGFRDGGGEIAACAAQPLTPVGGGSGGASTATCTVTYPATGGVSVTANYAADPSFAASSSTTETLEVAKDATVTTVGSSASPAAYSSRALTVRATVAASAPGSGTPTGKVAFSAVVDGKSLPLQCTGAAGSGGALLVSGVPRSARWNVASFAVPGGDLYDHCEDGGYARAATSPAPGPCSSRSRGSPRPRPSP